MQIIPVSIEHWPLLQPFYKAIYKPGHPLQNKEFWQWQFGNPQFGQAFVAIDKEAIIGHLGVSLSDGFAWHINLYVSPEHRGSGALLALMDAVSPLGRQGNLNANTDAVKLYRLMGWYQYTNLIRLTCINPSFANASIDELLQAIPFEAANATKPQGHYWQQPLIQAVTLPDGSTAAAQPAVGGLRFVEIASPKKAMNHAWEMGFKWVDYITSFNNPLLLKLEKLGWQLDSDSHMPWLLNPVVKQSVSNVTFLSKEPIPIEFYVNRAHSDIGRTGSIQPSYI